jgi:hypothetical protein
LPEANVPFRALGGWTFCWGAFGTLRDNTIWLISSWVLNETYLKTMLFHLIFNEIRRNGTKMTPGDAESEKMAPRVSIKEPEGAKRVPIGAKSEPTGSQQSPKGASWSQKGIKSEPKGDQNASTNRSSEKVVKMDPKWCVPLMLFGSVLKYFPTTIQ